MTDLWLVTLVQQQLIYCGHILFNVCLFGVPLLRFQSVQFFKNNVSQGSAATSLRCVEESPMIT